MATLFIVKKDIDTKIFTSNKAFGTDQGQDYSLVGSLDCTVKSLTLWAGKSFGKLVVEKHDGSSITVGDARVNPPEYRRIVFEFQREDKFTNIEFHSNGNILAGLRLGLKGQSKALEATINGYDLSSTKPEHVKVVQPGSGRLVGVFGNAGACLQSMGFAMMRS